MTNHHSPLRSIPESRLLPCATPGAIETLSYGNKYALLYSPAAPAERILYLIHGGGGDQHSFFCPDFIHMIDNMIAGGELEPLYIVSPCFYDPAETDKSPAASGRAVAQFCAELRRDVMPRVEDSLGKSFDRRRRAVSGFSMGGVATWYALMQALDLFYWFLPLSGDCWACGEKGGGAHPDKTAAELARAVERQGSLPFRIHAYTGDRDIAFENLDAQIRAMRACPEAFGTQLEYTVLPGGVHDYPTIFRYLYNALPEIGG